MKATGFSSRKTVFSGTKHSSIGWISGLKSNSLKRKRKSQPKVKVLIAIALLAVIGVVAFYAISSNTVLTIGPEVKIVGVTTPLTVKLSNPHAVRRIGAYIEQGGARYSLTEVKTPAPPLFSLPPHPS